MVRGDCWMYRPPLLPEIVLAANSPVPPMMLSGASTNWMAYWPFPIADVPSPDSPIQLPDTRFPVAVEPVIITPPRRLPEMTLRTPASTPPTTLLRALASSTPAFWLGSAAIPIAFKPMRLPSMRLPPTEPLVM